jgi:hypothetical protein
VIPLDADDPQRQRVRAIDAVRRQIEQAVEVVEVARRGVLADAEVLREILVTHRVPAACAVGETRFECEVLLN